MTSVVLLYWNSQQICANLSWQISLSDDLCLFRHLCFSQTRPSYLLASKAFQSDCEKKSSSKKLPPVGVWSNNHWFVSLLCVLSKRMALAHQSMITRTTITKYSCCLLLYFYCRRVIPVFESFCSGNWM